MITSAFLSILYFLLLGLIAVLPTATVLPSAVDSALNFFVPFWSAWNNIFPLTSIFTIIGLVLTIEFSILIFKSVNWIYNKIRGSG